MEAAGTAAIAFSYQARPPRNDVCLALKEELPGGELALSQKANNRQRLYAAKRVCTARLAFTVLSGREVLPYRARHCAR